MIVWSCVSDLKSSIQTCRASESKNSRLIQLRMHAYNLYTALEDSSCGNWSCAYVVPISRVMATLPRI